MTFTLDTSGSVDHVVAPGCTETGLALEWADLSPFVQGYVEALLADWRAALERGRRHPLPLGMVPRFADLAPEALALILRDCEAWSHQYTHPAFDPGPRVRGQHFWRDRNRAPFFRDFPPLTPYLGDDGRVRLREA